MWIGKFEMSNNLDEDEYKNRNTFWICKCLENIFYKYSISTQLVVYCYHNRTFFCLNFLKCKNYFEHFECKVVVPIEPIVLAIFKYKINYI